LKLLKNKKRREVLESSLQQARKDPGSTKAKILMVARRIFGDYGFHGTTTRMIAREVGIDVSTLYYHWGEKGDLYEAVVLDINQDLRKKLIELEGKIRGFPLGKRMEIAIDVMVDYLFSHPEITSVILSRYFLKTRCKTDQNIQLPEYISNIAFSMELSKNRKKVPARSKMQVLAILNAIYTFVSGAEFFQASLGIERGEYVSLVKETLRFVLIPAFDKPTSDARGKREEK